MAIAGRIECTNYATTCHRLATKEIDGKPYCPSCATSVHGGPQGYARTRYNEDAARIARRNTRVVVSQPLRLKAG